MLNECEASCKKKVLPHIKYTQVHIYVTGTQYQWQISTVHRLIFITIVMFFNHSMYVHVLLACLYHLRNECQTTASVAANKKINIDEIIGKIYSSPLSTVDNVLSFIFTSTLLSVTYNCIGSVDREHDSS